MFDIKLIDMIREAVTPGSGITVRQLEALEYGNNKRIGQIIAGALQDKGDDYITIVKEAFHFHPLDMPTFAEDVMEMASEELLIQGMESYLPFQIKKYEDDDIFIPQLGNCGQKFFEKLGIKWKGKVTVEDMMKFGALVYLDDGKVSIYNQYLKAYYVKNLSDIPRPEEVYIIYPMTLTYTIHGGIRYQIVNRASKCVKRLHAVLARASVPESEIAKYIVPDIPSAKYQISEKDLSKLERAIQWTEMRQSVTEMLEFLEKEKRNAKYNKVNLTHIANVSPSTYLVELKNTFLVLLKSQMISLSNN